MAYEWCEAYQSCQFSKGQARNSAEFSGIRRNKCERSGNSMTCKQSVIGTDRLSFLFQVCANPRGLQCSAGIKSQVRGRYPTKDGPSRALWLDRNIFRHPCEVHTV